MNIDMENYSVILSNNDIELLHKITEYLVNKVKLPELGHYKSTSDEDLWLKIVIQFCVVGGTRMIDNLIDNSSKYSEFKREIELNKLLSINKSDRLDHIGNTLKNFKATRFHQKQANKLNEILDISKIVRGGRIVLLEGLSYTQPFYEIRGKLMEKNRHFELKSASDFMINVGLSHDVIALDTRVVGILNKYFYLNVDTNKVQGNEKIYTSIEQALRQACKKINISLAHLDRMLFKFSNKNAISFIVEDL